MIKKGIHPSAVVEVLGRGMVPDTTILEPQAVIFIGPRASLDLGEQNILYPHASIRIDQGDMSTGREVSFGPGCHIYEPRGGLSIGDYCMIGGGSLICGVNHGATRTDQPMRHQKPVVAPIVIEDDVWIGMGVKVLPGVTIGRGAVIGAGSIVTRDIPPLVVAAGVPCRVKRQRSGDEQVGNERSGDAQSGE